MIKFRIIPSLGDEGGGIFVFLNDELRGEILGEGEGTGAWKLLLIGKEEGGHDLKTGEPTFSRQFMEDL